MFIFLFAPSNFTLLDKCCRQWNIVIAEIADHLIYEFLTFKTKIAYRQKNKNKTYEKTGEKKETECIARARIFFSR